MRSGAACRLKVTTSLISIDGSCKAGRRCSGRSLMLTSSYFKASGSPLAPTICPSPSPFPQAPHSSETSRQPRPIVRNAIANFRALWARVFTRLLVDFVPIDACSHHCGRRTRLAFLRCNPRPGVPGRVDLRLEHPARACGARSLQEMEH